MISGQNTNPPVRQIYINVTSGSKSLQEQLDQFPLFIDLLMVEGNSFFQKDAPTHILKDKDGDEIALKDKNGNDVVLIFSHNLIKSTSDIAGNAKFYVISTADEGYDDESLMLGKGSFSRVRAITHSIEISSDRKITVQRSTGKAVRIKNTQEAELNRFNTMTRTYLAYDFDEADTEYEISKNFPHLGMEKPRHIIKEKPNHENINLRDPFIKSYSVMNALPGQEINVVFDPKKFGAMTIDEVLESLIIPVLETYKKQVADMHYVHRDIKPGNILLALGMLGAPNQPGKPAVVNFIDFDMSVPIGDPEDKLGSPAYMPPEIASQKPEFVQTCFATQKRDIFALGMVLISCINPDLDPVNFFKTAGVYENDNKIKIETQGDINEKWAELLHSLGGWYNPHVLLEKAHRAGKSEIKYDKLGLFTYLRGADIENMAVQEQILKLFEIMTSENPDNRYEIERLIAMSKEILLNLPSRMKMIEKQTSVLFSNNSSTFFDVEGRVSPNARRNNSNSPKKENKENGGVKSQNSSPKKSPKKSPSKSHQIENKENPSLPRRKSSSGNGSSRKKLSFNEDETTTNVFGGKSPRKNNF